MSTVTTDLDIVFPSQLYGNFSNVSFYNYSDYSDDDYIFDRTDVRVIFITLYSIVFSCCFFGNLMVILVVTLSRRLRSITNFFLANLAVADLCVGVFCVYQNLSMYLISTWVLGDFLCKMYQFIHSLSQTASIFILIVICTERYFAIIHPITCKQILTPTRLRLVIGAVWVTSALYSAPRFLWVQTIVNPMHNGATETICATHRQRYNSKLFDIINFVFLYVIPLAVMTMMATLHFFAHGSYQKSVARRISVEKDSYMVLYTRIAVGLFQSSRELEKHLNASISVQQKHTVQYYHHTCSHACQQLPQKDSAFYTTRYKQQPLNAKFALECRPRTLTGGAMAIMHHPSSTQNVLRARRGVIRMLIVILLTFAVCNLPYHARKMWQYWSSGYRGSSDFSTLFTPITFLITYINSGVNPLLYAFLSRNFRRGMQEILLCSLRTHTRHPPSHKFYNGAAPSKEGGFDSLLKREGSARAPSSTVTIVHNACSDSYSNDV